MSAPLLATKLRVPPRRDDLVPRERLFARLDQSLVCRLCLVSAPAGFGKTTLLAGWLAARREQEQFASAWVSLDTGDNDLIRFFSYLAAALAGVIPTLTEEIEPLLHAPHPPSGEELITALINRLLLAGDDRGSQDVVLVLDDYHLLTAPAIHEALSFLLERQPATLHLILLTRADPPLPIPRLRSQGQLLELRQGDLRFSSAEATAFLQEVMGLSLGKPELATLHKNTEGWIAGLQMAALALRGRPEEETAAFVAAFSGTHRYVLDYLLEEVLQRQPESVQQFLLRTSILERLSAPLCDFMLTPDTPAPSQRAQSILEHLDSHNLFLVPLDEQRHWYRYHRLFADLLQWRLQQELPAQVPALHRRAAAWYEAQGETGAAIGHLLAGGALEEAAALVANAAEGAVMRGEVMTLVQWGEALPEQAIASRPGLALLYAWALLLAGRPADTVERWLQMVEARAEMAEWSGVIRGYLTLFEGRPEQARRLCAQALAALPPDALFLRQLGLLVQSMAARYQADGPDPEQALAETTRAGTAADNILIAVFGLCLRADLLMRRGDLAAAQTIYERALKQATRPDGARLPIASEPLLGLATLALERFDLEQAEVLLQEALTLTPRWSRIAALDGYALLARLQRLQGNYGAMWEALDEAERVARRFDATEMDDQIVALYRAQMALMLGQSGPAQRLLEGGEVHPGAEPGDDDLPLRKYEFLLLARLLLEEERPADAGALLDNLLPRFDRLRARIAIYLLRARALGQQGQQRAALETVQEALMLGQKSGMIGVFLEEGEPVAHLLYQALEAGIAPDFVGRLLAALPAAAAAVAQPPVVEPLVEPLSDREQEVLALIAEGQTNQEIADCLYLSLATVKWHSSNIYGKLAVGNRTEAVAKARALGLLAGGA